MSSVRPGIDFTQFPLQVGSLVAGKYIVKKGSKGVKLNGIDAIRAEEVVESLKDACSVVNYNFSIPNTDPAIVVVPNYITEKLRQEIFWSGRSANINITQVIDQHTAVAVAYAEKVRPTSTRKIGIISLCEGVIEVSLISVIPIDVTNINYDYVLHDRKECYEKFDFMDQQSLGHSSGGIAGFMGDTAKTLVFDPFEAFTEIIKSLLENIRIDDMDTVQNVVLVGKTASSKKLQQAVLERFHGSEVWPGTDEADELAAYGATEIAYKNTTINMIRQVPDGSAADFGLFHHGG